MYRQLYKRVSQLPIQFVNCYNVAKDQSCIKEIIILLFL